MTNARDQIDTAEQALIAMLQRHGYADAACFAVRLAFEEAIVNAFRHGHKSLPKSTPVEVAMAVAGRKATVSITDQGPGFVPEAVPDCTLDENLEKTSGRGLMLIRSFMSEVRHELGGRRVVMVFDQDAPPSD